MSKSYNNTSAVVDTILKILVAGSTLTAGAVAPNVLSALDKPLNQFFKKMDKRSRERETKRILYYMRQQDLIRPTSESYEHGIQITDKGRDRLDQINTSGIPRPINWDGKWRIVIYDIPESHKIARMALARKLRRLNFYQLQRSTWIHPFPCRDEITAITSQFDVNKYVSYFETDSIDQQAKLIERFKHLGL